MARYIDADKLLEYYEERHKHLCEQNGETDAYCQGYEDAMCVAEHPDFAADVVPKSEVVLASSDAVKMLIECHGYALTHDADIKKEVAMEIFEELEKWLSGDDSLKIITANKFSEIKKKYTEGE